MTKRDKKQVHIRWRWGQRRTRRVYLKYSVVTSLWFGLKTVLRWITVIYKRRGTSVINNTKLRIGNWEIDRYFWRIELISNPILLWLLLLLLILLLLPLTLGLLSTTPTLPKLLGQILLLITGADPGFYRRGAVGYNNDKQSSNQRINNLRNLDRMGWGWGSGNFKLKLNTAIGISWHLACPLLEPRLDT